MQGPPFYLFYMPSGPGSFSLSQRRTYYSNDYAHLYMLFAMLALAEEPTVIPPIYMIPPIVNVCPGQDWLNTDFWVKPSGGEVKQSTTD